MSDQRQSQAARQTIRLADPAPRLVTPFTLTVSADDRTRLAEELGISGVKKLAFEGKLTPQGRNDWTLEAKLGATVVQPCVVSLAPVTTRISSSPVTRRYTTHMPEITTGEEEMPDDDIEPLPQYLDLWELVAEALSLALPPYPRASDATLGEFVVTEPGKEVMDSEAAKPFAGLAALRNSLQSKGDDTE